MCDVMPTITEDNIGQRHQFSGEDVRINEFMDTVVEERNKLLDTLSKSQIRLDETEKQLAEVESERNALQRQIDATFPKVRLNFKYLLMIRHIYSTRSIVYILQANCLKLTINVKNKNYNT